MSGQIPGTGWIVVMPVKQLDIAKSRLLLQFAHRRNLAHAMALDSATAVLSAPDVVELVVVTADPDVATSMAALGARVVADEPEGGLNHALTHGIELARESAADAAVATVAADLPALRPEDLSAVLSRVVSTGFVADLAGTGTTLLAARPGYGLIPLFGLNSRDRHLASGAVDLSDSAAASVRIDVDTVADLRTAAEIGLGPRTKIAGHEAGCLS